MSKHLLRIACLVLIFSSCVTTSRNTTSVRQVNTTTADIDIPATQLPDSLTNLDRTQDGAFILQPGFYEATFKTYCLQPGTPDPKPGNAYLHAPITGYRKDIVQSVLNNSRSTPSVEQRNVQLLLWNVVSGSDYNKLSIEVRADAERLLTPKQIFELKGGVLGVIRTVSSNMPNSGVKRLFETGASSYEAYEKIAVLREPATELKADFKYDQWYKHDDYYVRYFPQSYKQVKVQVYVPSDLNNDDYVIFDPTGSQVIPANSNAQRLGVGGVLIDVIRKVIIVNRKKETPKSEPKPQPKPRTGKPI